MFARTVRMHLKPNSVTQFTQTMEIKTPSVIHHPLRNNSVLSLYMSLREIA
jgi:hypothetical protein